MRKTARILSLITVLVLLMTQIAAGLEIVKVTPEDGAKGKQVSNMAIKVQFDENMIDPAAIADNKGKFSITDIEGKEQSFQIVFSEEKYPNELWLILEGELVSDSEYTFKVEPGVVSKSGSALSNGITTTFRTRNTKTDSRISTLLMFGMMGVMFYTTSKATKKAAEEQGSAPVETKQYNPYKMAKEKGISVEEAKQIIAKEKEKDAKKAQAAAEKKRARDEAMAAEVAARQKELEEEYEAARRASRYQVKGPRSIKEAGGTVPKSVIKKNKAKRAAREKAAK